MAQYKKEDQESVRARHAAKAAATPAAAANPAAANTETEPSDPPKVDQSQVSSKPQEREES